MESLFGVAAGWYHAVLLGALPWMVALMPHWAPPVVALAVVGFLLGVRSRRDDPWPWCVSAASAAAALVVTGSWPVSAGWIVLSAAVGAIRRWTAGRSGRLRHTAPTVAVVGWAVALSMRPELMAGSAGGWLAPAVLLLAAVRLGDAFGGRRVVRASVLMPPSREVRGTLSLRSVVAKGADGLPRTVPLDLELRAGQSVAVLCGSQTDAWTLAETMAGRRPPAAGEVAVDGAAVRGGDRLMAVVAPGEEFLAGGLELNLAALCEEYPDRETLVATMEACGLDEVADALGDAELDDDGAPLSTLHRLMVVAARVVPSSYRLMVVVDPMPWTNPVHGGIWRSSVVRASLGRTAIWITADRELADRADRVLAFRSGGLRPVEPAQPE